MFERVYLGLFQVMKWFWAVVSSFTQEELARLLQFTTGSSQLPPGGFNTLCPSFQIIAAPTHSTLPTAHTWSVRKHRLMYWVHQVSRVFPRKHRLDGWTEMFSWDVHSSHLGFLLIFGERLIFFSRVIISQNSRSNSGLCSVSLLMILGRSVCSVRFYTSLPCFKLYKSWLGPGCNNI